MLEELSSNFITMSLINTNQQCRWHSFTATGELEQAAVQAILRAAESSICHRQAFHIVLAGGATPRRIYELLCKADADWAAWHVYFGDERCLPPAHMERNSRMAALAWLDHVAIPSEQIQSIHAENDAEIAAGSYAKIVNQIKFFDLVLLGLGEDGHTASLFPNHEWGTSCTAPSVIAVHDAPKPPRDRVSLSAHRLSAAYQVIFLVAGETKQQAVRDWLNEINIPAASITPQSGVDIYIEKALLSVAVDQGG
jgi:6-phosphogluconolactonase